MAVDQQNRAAAIEEEAGWAVVSIGLGNHRDEGRETYDALLALLPHSLVALLLVERPTIPSCAKEKRAPAWKLPRPRRRHGGATE